MHDDDVSTSEAGMTEKAWPAHSHRRANLHGAPENEVGRYPAALSRPFCQAEAGLKPLRAAAGAF
jgi:hypothetical protein